MGNFKLFVDAVDNIMNYGRKGKVGFLSVEVNTSSEEKNLINIDNKPVINFGSCSYLGMEFDERLKEGAIQAIKTSGTQFSSSRAYVSINLYEEFEQLLNQIFDAHCIVTPTTTLGHISAIPILVNDEDAVIMDHQVHNSVKTAVTLLKARGITVEVIRHNNMEMLEASIKRLSNQNKNIWYMADGIYSMYGDHCPIEEIERLLNKYKNFHFYVDDAHGMGWYGDRGQGFVLSKMKMHSRMVIATSMAKAFATGGGILVFQNEKILKRVRNCGGPMIFSGPLQPANLGAGIACAKIHLSDEITEIQNELWENIHYTKQIIQELELPCVSISDSPVFFIGVSLSRIGNEMVRKMIGKGYFLNWGIFPAVGMKNTGLRMTITRLHTKEQIKNMLFELKETLEETLEEQNFSYEEIYEAFQMLPTVKVKPKAKASPKLGLKVKTYQRIKDVNSEIWDKHFRSKGILNYETIAIMESTFSNNEKKEDNWSFEYVLIVDNQDQPILMTFLTTSLGKDDMMSGREVSRVLESLRKKNDPYYLTSEVLSVGAPFSEGEQFYLDKEHPLWKEALRELLILIDKRQQTGNINQLIIRDFEDLDPVVEEIIAGQGYIKFELPNNNYMDDFSWNTLEEFKQPLSRNSKRCLNSHILRNMEKFDLVIKEQPSEADIQHWYQLYDNIRRNNYSINTFPIPFKLFKLITNNPDWIVLELVPKQAIELPDNDGRSVAMMICQKNGDTLNALLGGANYDYQEDHRPYSCVLYETVLYAKRNNFKLLNLGYTADREKRKVGAKQKTTYAFMQIQDGFNMEVIMQKEMSVK